jgi:hypothetical protein
VTVWQTVLVFVGIPAGIIAVLTLAVYGKAMVRQPNRYRPGKGWNYPAQWFVPHPEVTAHPRSGTSTTAVGGASGEW